MLVKDIMTAPLITIHSDRRLADAVQLMVVHRLSALPVLDELGKLCGLISEGDLLHRSEIGTSKHPRRNLLGWFLSEDAAVAYRMANGRQVMEVMSKPVIAIEETEALEVAVDRMEKHQIKHLPVLREDALVGIVSRFDFVRALQAFLTPAYEEQATSDGEIKDRIVAEVGLQSWARSCTLDAVVDNGQVILRGTAGNDDQRCAMRVAAENVPGVRSVVNDVVLLESFVMLGV